MPGVFRCDLTNACAFYHYRCTRGYRAHRTPGIPCALVVWEGGTNDKPCAKRAARSRSHAQCAPLPPRALARGGEGSGVGGLSVYSSGREFAEAPPTPDPSPPLRGGRGGTDGDGGLFETRTRSHAR